MKEERKQYIETGKEAKGRLEFERYKNGAELSMLQAIYAKCYDCEGAYDGGKQDCTAMDCPLHPFMPYNPERRKKTMSPESIERLRRISPVSRMKNL